MDDLISVIIPVYNTEKYLGDCIESLMSQTHQRLEILIIDDGSIDSSGIIADEYSKIDPRVKVEHIPNGGVSIARNKGIDLSTGEWIAFVDSDDTIASDYFETLLCIAVYNKADIAMGISNVMEEDGYIHRKTNDNVCVQRFDQKEAIMHLLKADLFGCGINKIYKKRIWNDIRFDSKINVNEDLLINYFCFCKAETVAYTNKHIYNYRNRLESTSRKGTNKYMLDSVKVNYIIQMDAKEKSENKTIYEVAFARYVGVLVSSYRGAVDPIKKELYQKIRYNLKEALLCKMISITKKLEILFLVLFPKLYKRII